MAAEKTQRPWRKVTTSQGVYNARTRVLVKDFICLVELRRLAGHQRCDFRRLGKLHRKVMLGGTYSGYCSRLIYYFIFRLYV
jgi:hypothetical protein